MYGTISAVQRIIFVLICSFCISTFMACSGGGSSNSKELQSSSILSSEQSSSSIENSSSSSSSLADIRMFEGSPVKAEAFKIASYQSKKVQTDSGSLSGTWLYTESVDYNYRGQFHDENERRHSVFDRRMLIAIEEGDDGELVGYYLSPRGIESLVMHRWDEDVVISWDRTYFQGVVAGNSEIIGELRDDEPRYTQTFATDVNIQRSDAGMIKISNKNFLGDLSDAPAWGSMTVETSAGDGVSETVDIHLFTEDVFRWSWVENGIETATDHIYASYLLNFEQNEKWLGAYYVDKRHKALVVGLWSQVETEEDPVGWKIQTYEPFRADFFKQGLELDNPIIESSDKSGLRGSYNGLDENGAAINAMFDLHL